MVRNDWFLLVGVLGLAIALGAFNLVRTTQVQGLAMQVVVKVDGKEVKTLPLEEDHEERLLTEHGYNVVHIEGGEASITDADCRDQICVRTRAISRPGESVVCLPYRVTLEIRGRSGEGGEVDAVAQ
ncbi:NusG domain II-containing protein [Anaerotalea alkaliphila]|uniref:NusG domain II-containing protein n=1 Tax=Anaerotalea alkaliphila TaxID=2662126 RepID=A0A7X5KMQ6_9FIRM|nr:NusG domain II-containing protein [Anaerotalea alkaliphila]NDL67214.1 NusG domain II-containing protein [Anaerotalea alkaliphila]